MNAWWLVALLVPTSLLAIRAAFYYRGRAAYFCACKDAQVEESMRLAQMVRDSEAAYAGLLESLKVGGIVRVPTDEQLEKGAW